jgi:hypothetical protein
MAVHRNVGQIVQQLGGAVLPLHLRKQFRLLSFINLTKPCSQIKTLQQTNHCSFSFLIVPASIASMQ